MQSSFNNLNNRSYLSYGAPGLVQPIIGGQTQATTMAGTTTNQRCPAPTNLNIGPIPLVVPPLNPPILQNTTTSSGSLYQNPNQNNNNSSGNPNQNNSNNSSGNPNQNNNSNNSSYSIANNNKLSANLIQVIQQTIRQEFANNYGKTTPTTTMAGKSASTSASTPTSTQLELQVKSIIDQLSPILVQFRNISKNIPYLFSSSLPPLYNGQKNVSDVEQFQQQQLISICTQLQFLEDQFKANFKPDVVVDGPPTLTKIIQVLNVQKLIVQLQLDITTLQYDVTGIQDQIYVDGPLKTQISTLQGKIKTFFQQSTLLMEKVFKKFLEVTAEGEGDQEKNSI